MFPWPVSCFLSGLLRKVHLDQWAPAPGLSPLRSFLLRFHPGKQTASQVLLRGPSSLQALLACLFPSSPCLICLSSLHDGCGTVGTRHLLVESLSQRGCIVTGRWGATASPGTVRNRVSRRCLWASLGACLKMWNLSQCCFQVSPVEVPLAGAWAFPHGDNLRN